MQNRWTNEEKEKLELYYKQGLSFAEISKLLNHSISSINSMSYELKLGNKYMRTNNPNFKACYQEYDWCYDRFITKGMSMHEMAEEAGCKVRTIQKWCNEKHKLNNDVFKDIKKLSDIQKDLIKAGILGDGHIDKRETQPMYIESHAENEKDYIFWKYSILKDIMKNPPKYYKSKYNEFNGKNYKCQPYYRMNSRIVNDLKPLRDLTKYEIIDNLNEFEFSIFMLDDGCRSGTWEICVAEFTQEERDLFIDICKEKFNLRGCIKEDVRYISFDTISSDYIDEIILRNIPNTLDIINKKIYNNPSIRHSANRFYYIITSNKRIGYTTYCKQNHINYDLYRKFVIENSNDFNEIDENIFLKEVEKNHEELYNITSA